MKCDGATDDSAALQSALTSASDPGLGNTKVVLPPGTCIIDPAAAITINSGLWLQGAGRYGTTLKRKNSSAGGALLTFNADGITLSDFAIDGNKGGSGITAAADSILVNAPSSGVTITRMHFLNASGSDISSLKSGVGIFISDWLIVNNDFDNGGTPACAVASSLRQCPHSAAVDMASLFSATVPICRSTLFCSAPLPVAGRWRSATTSSPISTDSVSLLAEAPLALPALTSTTTS